MLEELIITHRPILYLHSAEKDFPSSIDSYLNNVNVFVDNQVQVRRPTQDMLYRFSQQHNDAKKAYMNPTSLKGKLGSLDAPCYAIIQDFDAQRPYKIYVTYVYFYPYNNSSTVFGLVEAGEHYADIEHITIEFDRQQQPLRYYYATHTNTEGTWHTPDELEFEDQRPVVYVAKGSHACYNKPGVYPRIFGAVTDRTNKGYRWDPMCQIVWNVLDPEFSEDNSWFFYPGLWGNNSTRGVAEQWWFKRLPSVSKRHVRCSETMWFWFSWLVWITYLLSIATSGVFISNELTETKIESMAFLILWSATIYCGVLSGLHCLVRAVT